MAAQRRGEPSERVSSRSGIIRGETGFTLAEIALSVVILSVVILGIGATWVAIAEQNRRGSTGDSAEAQAFGRQTLESLRNEVAADSTFFQTADGTGWITDALPAPTTEQGVNFWADARRCFRVNALDCDGVGGVGDCYEVDTAVCWHEFDTCPCP